MTDLTLSIGGVHYSGWKAARVTIGLDQMAGSFELDCADRWAIQGQPLPIVTNLSCAIAIDQHAVVTGYVDELAVEYSERQHRLTIRGRDAAGDLVDSAAITDGSGWVGRSLAQIAEDLCKPFGIRVTIAPSAAADAALNYLYNHLQVGETVFEALQRLARIRGCLVVSDGLGGVQITRAGAQRASTVLELGKNILQARSSNSVTARFYEYRVLAQNAGAGTFQLTGGVNLMQQVLGHSNDSAIRKARITIIDPVDAADTQSAQQLADWTRSQRAARGNKCTLTVRGWLDGTTPWRPNSIVTVRDPWTRFTGRYLITTVEFSLDDQAGQIVKLTVAPPDAYNVLKIREIDPALGANVQLSTAPPK